MKADLKPGLRHVQTLEVGQDLLVPSLAHVFASFSDMPPVLATAYLIAFLEWACIEALAPYLEAGERTVGTHVDVSHIAATPAGMPITAEVELLAIQGRKLRFKVVCRDARERIGEGFHERALIDAAKFSARVAAKAVGSGGSP